MGNRVNGKLTKLHRLDYGCGDVSGGFRMLVNLGEVSLWLLQHQLAAVYFNRFSDDEAGRWQKREKRLQSRHSSGLPTRPSGVEAANPRIISGVEKTSWKGVSITPR